MKRLYDDESVNDDDFEGQNDEMVEVDDEVDDDEVGDEMVEVEIVVDDDEVAEVDDEVDDDLEMECHDVI